LEAAIAKSFTAFIALLVLTQIAGARSLNNQFQQSNAARKGSGEAAAYSSKRPPRAYSGTNPQSAARLQQLRGMGTLNSTIRSGGSKK
jgi:hypothetical protein